MPYTQADIINEALDLLGVTQVGQDASAEDVGVVGRLIPGKFAELAQRRVYYVQDPNAIDDECFLPLARIVANAAAPKFGQPRDPAVDADAEATLREMQREPGIRDVVRAEYF